MAEEQAPPAPSANSMFSMMLVFGMMALIMFVPSIRIAIGDYAGYVLDPIIGFDGDYPVLTILASGFLAIVISTVTRHFMTDPIKMAKDQAVSKHLQKEMRKAQKENNLYKMRKLQEVQTQNMANTSSTMMDSMKPMFYTIFIFIGIFTWLSNFLYSPDTFEYASFGWSSRFYFFDNFIIIPYWILIYMLVSFSLGQVLQKGLKYYSFSKKIGERET